MNAAAHADGSIHNFASTIRPESGNVEQKSGKRRNCLFHVLNIPGRLRRDTRTKDCKQNCSLQTAGSTKRKMSSPPLWHRNGYILKSWLYFTVLGVLGVKHQAPAPLSTKDRPLYNYLLQSSFSTVLPSASLKMWLATSIIGVLFLTSMVVKCPDGHIMASSELPIVFRQCFPFVPDSVSFKTRRADALLPSMLLRFSLKCVLLCWTF